MADPDLTALRRMIGEMLPDLRNEFGVGRLWIVGSRARKDNRPDSDLDVVVELERRGISLLGFCRMERMLSERLGVQVDLVEMGAMRPQVAEAIGKDAIAI